MYCTYILKQLVLFKVQHFKKNVMAMMSSIKYTIIQLFMIYYRF